MPQLGDRGPTCLSPSILPLKMLVILISYPPPTVPPCNLVILRLRMSLFSLLRTPPSRRRRKHLCRRRLTLLWACTRTAVPRLVSRILWPRTDSRRTVCLRSDLLRRSRTPLPTLRGRPEYMKPTRNTLPATPPTVKVVLRRTLLPSPMQCMVRLP